MLVNHNIYTYHRYSIDACDLVFIETKKNHARVPTKTLEIAELIENYFTAENAGEIEERLAVLMEPFIRKGKAAYLEIYANLQQGKTYFSITTKEGVEKYLSFCMRDVELGHIIKGRHTTIATHLQHFLSFIGKDTKLKELERTDCESYFYHRYTATNGYVKQVTVQNEQSTINALMG